MELDRNTITDIAEVKANVHHTVVNMERMFTYIEQINAKLDNLDSKYVLKAEFEIHKELMTNQLAPLYKFVYGVIGLVLTAVGLAVITLITNLPK